MGGAVVPHAPLLLPEVSGPSVSGRVAEVAAAVRDIALDATAIVLASPHGPEQGIYAGRRGDLAGFGRPGVSVETSSADDLAGQLGRTWGVPTLGSALDHGVVVPVALGLMAGTRLVAVSVRNVQQGLALAQAVTQIAGSRPTKIAFVASGHLGSALTERAPGSLNPQAVELEERVLEAIPTDVGVLDGCATELEATGSCSAAVLAAFGCLFAGRPGHVLSYAAPFGVGYLASTVDG